MWIRPKIIQEHEDPADQHGYCPMERDRLLDTKCTCPDLLFLMQVRISTGGVVSARWSCACCGNPVDTNHPYFGRSTA